jgi:hypothetical protein
MALHIVLSAHFDNHPLADRPIVIDDILKSIGEFDFEIFKKKITHIEEGIKRCTKSLNGSCSN